MSGRNTYFQHIDRNGYGEDVYGFSSQWGMKAAEIAEMFFSSHWPEPQTFKRVTLSGVRAYERAWETEVPVHLVALCGDKKTFTVLF